MIFWISYCFRRNFYKKKLWNGRNLALKRAMRDFGLAIVAGQSGPLLVYFGIFLARMLVFWNVTSIKPWFQLLQQISTKVSIWVILRISRVHFCDTSLFIVFKVTTGNNFMINLDEEDHWYKKDNLLTEKNAPIICWLKCWGKVDQAR